MNQWKDHMRRHLQLLKQHVDMSYIAFGHFLVKNAWRASCNVQRIRLHTNIILPWYWWSYYFVITCGCWTSPTTRILYIIFDIGITLVSALGKCMPHHIAYSWHARLTASELIWFDMLGSQWATKAKSLSVYARFDGPVTRMSQISITCNVWFCLQVIMASIVAPSTGYKSGLMTLLVTQMNVMWWKHHWLLRRWHH